MIVKEEALPDDLVRIVDDHLHGWCVIWEEGRIPRITSNIATRELADKYAAGLLAQDERRRVVAVCLAETLRQLAR